MTDRTDNARAERHATLVALGARAARAQHSDDPGLLSGVLRDIAHELRSLAERERAAGRAETTTGAIARQIARETAMTGRDALELVEAVQALQDAETTTATTEDAEEVLHGAGWFARADLDPRDLRAILHDLADADLLATARTRPTREELSTLILSFLKPPKHSGGSWTLNPDDAADAVLALLRGGDK